MVTSIRQTLPALYHSLLPAFFDADAVSEKKATCDDCAMCSKGAEMAGVVYFRPDTKCCTYQPHLPNYLVGAVFRDGSPGLDEGRRRLRARIGSRRGVTPQRLSPPEKLSLLVVTSRESSFGRSLVLRCPYFEPEGGLCTIWKHRESVCSSYFCKHTSGEDGNKMWNALKAYLQHVELELSEYAVRSIASDLEKPKARPGRLTLEELEDRAPNAAQYSAMWRAWEGREEEFYVACHERIRGLSRDEFNAKVAVGEGPRLLGELESCYTALQSPVLAERLMLNPNLTAVPAAEGGVMVTTYSRYQPVLVSEQLYEVVKEFTGRESVVEVRARLARDHEIDVPEAMLISLQQVRVLVPAREEALEGRQPPISCVPENSGA